MPYLTDLEARLVGEQGPQVRKELIETLTAELQSTKRSLQQGLGPADYQRESAKQKALEASIEVLKTVTIAPQED